METVTYGAWDPGASHVDLTIVGAIKYADGLGRLPIGLAEILKDDMVINHRKTPFTDYRFEGISSEIVSVLKNGDQTAGNVALLTSPLWYTFGDIYTAVPQESLIKIAYSMLETTAIPQKWVVILNEKFDAVVVPDAFFDGVYRHSGVKIPVFVLPHGIFIDDFLKTPVTSTASEVFTFGQTAVFSSRKNQELLLEAFYQEFGADPQVRLRLHGCWSDRTYLKSLQRKITLWKAQNVELIEAVFSEQENSAFYTSLDCFVLLSKGEGFSVTPREALALGIPCVISNNTAHTTICDTGFVCSVPSLLQEKADYTFYFGNEDCGNNFCCSIEDARKALRDVYDRYSFYKEKALKARPWVSQYSWQNVKRRFLNLIKPEKILLGDHNIVTDSYLMTTSEELYKKYLKISQKKP